ncbi:MAG: hypothetical protein AAF481_18825 [Acidobacteriota bacterium]
MGVLRLHRAALAALQLAALVFISLVPHGHDCEPLSEARGHTDLSAEPAGNQQAIAATHVEEATLFESSPCLACLHQQRQRGAESHAIALGGVGPDSSSVELEHGEPVVSGASRLPASRAPPRA